MPLHKIPSLAECFQELLHGRLIGSGVQGQVNVFFFPGG